mmetsp:Transcript_119130/g.331041  ORF Transcript_119130/g.331041 Transcript_119130/m.331041 type:complete len:252 (-) Transcript_119130:651-1406(-)
MHSHTLRLCSALHLLLSLSRLALSDKQSCGWSSCTNAGRQDMNAPDAGSQPCATAPQPPLPGGWYIGCCIICPPCCTPCCGMKPCGCMKPWPGIIMGIIMTCPDGPDGMLNIWPPMFTPLPDWPVWPGATIPMGTMPCWPDMSPIGIIICICWPVNIWGCCCPCCWPCCWPCCMPCWFCIMFGLPCGAVMPCMLYICGYPICTVPPVWPEGAMTKPPCIGGPPICIIWLCWSCIGGPCCCCGACWCGCCCC